MKWWGWILSLLQSGCPGDSIGLDNFDHYRCSGTRLDTNQEN